MKYGIFDHMDYGGTQSPADFFENRLKLAELYDQQGYHAYHLAEHHATPLGMSPSPNVFLSALAQRTTTLRFGPLVYCLPLYHPLRLLEEICMLDQLSNGRLEMGIGRGISPIELDYFGLSAEDGPAMYKETFELILRGMEGGALTFEGEHYAVNDMPVTMSPMQRPHPPLWYGVQNPAATEWPAENALNVITNQTSAAASQITDNYTEAWLRAGRAEDDLPNLGMTRYVVIAETEEEAVMTASRAYPVWRKSFMALWDLHGQKPVGVNYPEAFDGVMETGQGIAGTAEQVTDILQAQIATAGINYLVCRFAFGDLTFDESRRSVELFTEQVRPNLSNSA